MKYFELPFENTPLNLYIRDSNCKTVFTWLIEDDNLKQKILQAINSSDKINKPYNATIVGRIICLDQKPILLVRGWGYLTGFLGLPQKEAIQEQNDLLNFVKEKLKGKI